MTRLTLSTGPKCWGGSITVLRLGWNALAPVGQKPKNAGALPRTVLLALVGLAAVAIVVIDALRSDWVLALVVTFLALDLGFRLLARIYRLPDGARPGWLVGVFFSRWVAEGAVVAVIIVLLLTGVR